MPKYTFRVDNDMPREFTIDVDAGTPVSAQARAWDELHDRVATEVSVTLEAEEE